MKQAHLLLNNVISTDISCAGSFFVNALKCSKRDMCIKGPPLEPKTENCFSQISFDWFIKRITEV